MLRVRSSQYKWKLPLLLHGSRPISSPISTEFFNRRKEMDMLSDQLKLNPCFHILTGPVNSGKSMVITKLMDDLKSRNVPVIDINLREVSFNSVESLVHTLKERTNSWLEQFVEAAEHCRLDAELYGFKLKLHIENSANASPIARLNTLLSSMQKKLPPYTFWYGTKLPVFIIDEANELRAITKDPNGQAALHNLLKCQCK